MRRLGDVREDRVVARHLPVMRVEPAKGAFDLQPGRDHHAIDIDRDRAESERRHHARNHAGVQILQAANGRHRELLQPAADRAGGRQPAEPREPAEQRVVRHIRHMAQPAPADDQQTDQQPDHRDHPVVAPWGRAPEDLTDQRVKAGAPQIPREQFQPGIRRQRDVVELERQIAIDTGLQIEFSLSHAQRRFVVDSGRLVALPFNHNGGPFSISKRRAA